MSNSCCYLVCRYICVIAAYLSWCGKWPLDECWIGFVIYLFEIFSHNCVLGLKQTDRQTDRQTYNANWYIVTPLCGHRWQSFMLLSCCQRKHYILLSLHNSKLLLLTLLWNECYWSVLNSKETSRAPYNFKKDSAAWQKKPWQRSQ